MKTILEYIQKKHIDIQTNQLENVELDGKYSFYGSYMGFDYKEDNYKWKKMSILVDNQIFHLFYASDSTWVFYRPDNKKQWSAFFYEPSIINKIKKDPEKFFDIITDTATIPEFTKVKTNLL